jgi:SAM-dependent methyltransferase
VAHDSASPATHPSVAVYTPGRLALYDFVILGFSCRFVWRCPKRRFLELYDRHVGARHLDVGVGSGYFLDRCHFSVERPAITLLDLSEPCLAKAARRLDRYSPQLVRANVLDPLDLGEARYDSIALNGVLHCLPATMDEKANVFRNLRPFLAEGGVLFGSTILGQGVDHGRLARKAIAVYNRERIFTNREDDRAALQRALAGSFARYETETQGSFALFAAREPHSAASHAREQHPAGRHPGPLGLEGARGRESLDLFGRRP